MRKTNICSNGISEEKIQQYKKIILNILIEFDAFLHEQGITYSLAAGTLLGAIRHRGFIPWDDDIDLIVSRSEFEKLIGCIKKFNPQKYEIVMPLDDSPLANPRLIKIYQKNTCLKEQGLTFFEGAFIDIFGSLDVDEKNAKRQMKKYRALTTMLMFKNHRIDLSNPPTKSSRLLHFASHFFSKKILKKRIRCFYSNITSGPYFCSSFGLANLYKKEWFKELVPCEFEGHSFPIFKEHAKMLEIAFGDYMSLPPIEERNPCHLEYLNFSENYLEKNSQLKTNGNHD